MKQTSALYAARWPLLGVTAAITFVLLDVVTGVLWPTVAHDLPSAVPIALVTVAASYYYQGMISLVVAAWTRGEPTPSIRGVVTAVPVMRLLTVDVLATGATYLGLALAVIPGIVLITVWSVVSPALVLEDRRVVSAFRRSKELVDGSFWPVAALAVAWLLLLVATTAFAILSAGAVSGDSILGVWTGVLIANALFAPIAAVGVGVTYFELLRLHNPSPGREASQSP